MNAPSAAVSPLRLERCDRTSSLEEQYALLFGLRTFEQSLLELFATGALAGTTHTCLGQETVAVGVMSAIDRERDIVFSNHRGHGHFLAYCGEVERLYLEIMGKPGGVCGGRGGSQHLYFDNFYSNGIQGGIVPVATGMALAEKQKGSGAVVVVFLGDGTLGEGVVYEAFNIASLWSMPIVFVIEHNGYAQSTPSALQIAGEVERLYLEILGKTGGVCGGRGGSQHLFLDNFYSNGIQGGIVPLATGMALAEKQRGSGAVAVVFLGDGTLGEGVVYEAFNIAALWQLPVVFVIEHNGYAQSTPSTLQIAGEVAARPRAFGISTRECRSTAVDEIAHHCAQAVATARAGGGPQCLICYTYRLGPHSKGDDTRPGQELSEAWLRDPLKTARAVLDETTAAAIEQRVGAEILAARIRALEATA